MADSEKTKDDTSSSTTQTVVIQEGSTADQHQSPPTLSLRLQKPEPRQKVQWSTDTVDNEFMGKKKSKCCCIYEKPKVFGESDTDSSSDEDDAGGCTPHCRGHKTKCYKHLPNLPTSGGPHDHDNNEDSHAAG